MSRTKARVREVAREGRQLRTGARVVGSAPRSGVHDQGVTICGHCKEHVGRHVDAAVENNGITLRFASKKLQADREVVMAAVAQDGFTLRFASKELQVDSELCALANK